MSTYGARKVTIDGITFASVGEGKRYEYLKLLQHVGEITCLELQPVFVLAEGVRLHGESRKRPALRYVADFRYRDRSGCVVIEDFKGMDTPASRIKRHLMATVHGFDVRVVR